MNLVHELRTASDHSCLVLHGKIDLAVRRELDQVLQHAVELSGTVTVDLHDVTYLDCSGIGVLVAAANAARHRGHFMIVNYPEGTVRCVLELTGVLPYLTAGSPAAMPRASTALVELV
ncbi:MAG: STAS domain-containing protein [Micromonosporaceae bacterium]